MQLFKISHLILIVFSLALSATYVAAENNAVKPQETQDEPFLTEKLTVRDLHFVASLYGYQVNVLEKAAPLTAKSVHLTCLAESQRYQQPVEVVFSAYSLQVNHCRLLPRL
ncbi:hypothetical protein [Methylophaga muralis]|uniref:Uncharacterized protein n=1 Tax=Methylophaga muralis TaxID=291169 RepID=A0A1E3GSI0_9GAMM|nr:hypothetical protein [Methylophaga muralis]ODN66341.1 hypothetical protein A9E74_01907 [Methylophaga muralis]